MITTVDPSTLNDRVEFDSPFRVLSATTIETPLPDVWAPNVYGFGDADGQITEKETIDSRDDWEFVDGYSGQYSYSGPVMHPSEFLGGGMARDVLAETGVTFVVVAVTDANDTTGDGAYGWALLRRTDDMAERHAAGSQDTDCEACAEGIAEQHQYEAPADPATEEADAKRLGYVSVDAYRSSMLHPRNCTL